MQAKLYENLEAVRLVAHFLAKRRGDLLGARHRSSPYQHWPSCGSFPHDFGYYSADLRAHTGCLNEWVSVKIGVQTFSLPIPSVTSTQLPIAIHGLPTLPSPATCSTLAAPVR